MYKMETNPHSRKAFVNQLVQSGIVITGGFLIRDALVASVQLALALIVGLIGALFRSEFAFSAVLPQGKLTELGSHLAAAVVFLSVAYDISRNVAPLG